MSLTKIKEFPRYKIRFSKTNQQPLIWDTLSKRWVSQCNDKDGYKFVNLYKDKKQVKRYVHRLVAQTFIENLNNKPCVDHKNECKYDNRLENLRWLTVSENNFNQLKSKGYYWDRKKYKAQIRVKEKTISLGYYDTKEKAAEAYQKAGDKYFPGVKIPKDQLLPWPDKY